MRSHSLIIFGSIFSLFSVIAAHLASSSLNDIPEEVLKMRRKVDTTMEDMEHQMQTTSLESTETGVTTDRRPWKAQSPGHHRHHVIRNAHGILNILGWGTLLPAGAIIARYLRKFPWKYDEWYPLHILCQTSGYLLGTLGWAIGLWLGNSSKQHTTTHKTHGILGILVFTFSTVQMLAVFVHPKRWEICHQIIGYAVIGLSIANIFQGATHQSHAEKWKWVYVGVLAILGLVAIAMEVFRWIKNRIQQ